MSSREFLHTLWKEVVCDRKIDLSQNAELSDQALRLKNVCRLPLDIENPATCLDSGLPFLFEPLPPAVLRDHPLSEITLATMKFYDFCDRPEIPGEVVPRTLSQRIQAV